MKNPLQLMHDAETAIESSMSGAGIYFGGILTVSVTAFGLLFLNSILERAFPNSEAASFVENHFIVIWLLVSGVFWAFYIFAPYDDEVVDGDEEGRR